MGVEASLPQFDVKPTEVTSEGAFAASKVYRLSKSHQKGQLISHLKFEKNAMDSSYPFHQMHLHDTAKFGVKHGLRCIYIVSA